MKRNIMYAAAVAALLLVGAGCGAKQQTAAGLQTRPPAGEAQVAGEAKTTASAVNAEGTVNGTVDAILKDSEDEKTAQMERESDSSDVNADDAELNAYSDNSYEVK